MILAPAAPPGPAPVALSDRMGPHAPNPGVMTGPGTNSYLVGTSDWSWSTPVPIDAGHMSGPWPI